MVARESKSRGTKANWAKVRGDQIISFTFVQLLWVGVHLGHDKVLNTILSSWAMVGMRNNIWVINLALTIFWFRRAYLFIREVMYIRGAILFVNHKMQMSRCIWESAFSCGQSFSVGKWVGGSLSNFKFIYRTLLKLPGIPGSKVPFIAKYRGDVGSRKFWSFGLIGLSRLPNGVFVSSMRESRLALFEAQSLRIPVISIVDSNCDSRSIIIPIPGNDDSLGCVRLYNKVVGKSILVNKMLILRSFRKLFFRRIRSRKWWDLLSMIRYSTYNLNGYIFKEKHRESRRRLLYICIYYWDLLKLSGQIFASWLRFSDYSWRRRYVGKFNWLDVFGDVSRNKIAVDKGLRLGLRYDREILLKLAKNRPKRTRG